MFFLPLISSILGIVFLCAAFTAPSNSGNAAVGLFLLVIALVSFLVIRRQSSKKQVQPSGAGTPAVRTSSAPAAAPTADSGTLTFRVAGTTFDNDDGTSRQEILRHLKFGDEPWADDPDDLMATIEEETYEGELAFAVFINDYQVGFVPKKQIREVEKARQNVATCYISDVKIIGGGTAEDGRKLSYGCSITIEY